VVRVDGVEKQKDHNGNRSQEGNARHVTRHEEWFRRSTAAAHLRLAKGRSRNETGVIVEEALVGGVVEKARFDVMNKVLFAGAVVNSVREFRGRVEKESAVVVDAVNDVVLCKQNKNGRGV